MKSLSKASIIALAAVILTFPVTLAGVFLFLSMGGGENAAAQIIAYVIYGFIILSITLSVFAALAKKCNLGLAIILSDIIWGFLLAFSYFTCAMNNIVFGHGGFNVMILALPVLLKAGVILTFIQYVVSYLYLSRDRKTAKILFAIAITPLLFVLFLYAFIDRVYAFDEGVKGVWSMLITWGKP